MKRLMLTALMGCMLMGQIKAGNLTQAVSNGLVWGVLAPVAAGTAIAVFERDDRFRRLTTDTPKHMAFLNGGTITSEGVTLTSHNNKQLPHLITASAAATRTFCFTGAFLATLRGLLYCCSSEGRTTLFNTVYSPNFVAISLSIGLTALTAHTIVTNTTPENDSQNN